MPAWLRMLTAAVRSGRRLCGAGRRRISDGRVRHGGARVPIGVHQPRSSGTSPRDSWSSPGRRACSRCGTPSSPASSLAYSAALAFAVGYAPALAAHAPVAVRANRPRRPRRGVGPSVSPIVRQNRAYRARFQESRDGMAGRAVLARGGARACDRRLVRRAQGAAVHAAVSFPLRGGSARSSCSAARSSTRSRIVSDAAFRRAGGRARARVWRIFRWSRVAGAVTLAAILTLFGMEQRAWYRQLAPDAETAAIIACLDRLGVRAAFSGLLVELQADVPHRRAHHCRSV